MKALPARIDESNCYRVPLFCFGEMQNAIIASQNEAQDMLFKFYDNRNKNRLRKLQLRARLTEQKAGTLLEDTTTLLTSYKAIANDE